MNKKAITTSKEQPYLAWRGMNRPLTTERTSLFVTDVNQTHEQRTNQQPAISTALTTLPDKCLLSSALTEKNAPTFCH